MSRHDDVLAALDSGLIAFKGRRILARLPGDRQRRTVVEYDHDPTEAEMIETAAGLWNGRDAPLVPIGMGDCG